jgi:hypothetical protein
MYRDILQIRVLAVLFFVFAVVIVYFSFLPFPALITGVTFFREGIQSSEPLAPTAFNLIFFFGIFFMTLVFPITALILGGLFAFNIAKFAYFLFTQQRYSFCVKMAGVNIFLLPFGTVLGILAYIILRRESVKELFSYSNSVVKS